MAIWPVPSSSSQVKQGVKFDAAESVADIAPFIKFHGLDVTEILDPLDSFKSFNECACTPWGFSDVADSSTASSGPTRVRSRARATMRPSSAPPTAA